jgi:hypothetical protein
VHESVVGGLRREVVPVDGGHATGAAAGLEPRGAQEQRVELRDCPVTPGSGGAQRRQPAGGVVVQARLRRTRLGGDAGRGRACHLLPPVVVERRQDPRGEVRRAAPVEQPEQGVQVPAQVRRYGGRHLRLDSHIGKVRAAPSNEVLTSVRPAGSPASAVRGHVIMADRPSDLREWVIAAWGAVCLRV